MNEVAFWSSLFAALAVGAIAFELRRDVVPFWRLFLPPLAAVACGLSLSSDPRWFALDVAALAIGMAAGGMRGARATVRVDHMWRTVRLRRVRDGVAAALVIAVLAGADIAPVVALLSSRFAPPPFAAAALLCAGYLLGRAGVIGYRARTIPTTTCGPVRSSSDSCQL